MVSFKFLIITLAVIAGFHTVFAINSWYYAYRWIDIPMHLVGGFWVALAFLFVTSTVRVIPSPPWFLFLCAVSVASFIGVLWELIEFVFDDFIASNGYGRFAQLGGADTMADLFFDIVGGVIAGIFMLRKKLVRV